MSQVVHIYFAATDCEKMEVPCRGLMQYLHVVTKGLRTGTVVYIMEGFHNKGRANSLNVRMILPAWLDDLRNFFLMKKFKSKHFACLFKPVALLLKTFNDTPDCGDPFKIYKQQNSANKKKVDKKSQLVGGRSVGYVQDVEEWNSGPPNTNQL